MSGLRDMSETTASCYQIADSKTMKYVYHVLKQSTSDLVGEEKNKKIASIVNNFPGFVEAILPDESEIRLPLLNVDLDSRLRPWEADLSFLNRD
ncbi:hypothetical protein GF327_02875 [Candidatus Woesearchaeota archaeon]|nr:hypothetical protein [Candidatus Woesearchaeota archaeon]